MNKKLRLLVTSKCPNKCPMCCNNSWDFSKLPVVDRWNYEEIMITGGEPLKYVSKVIGLIHNIRGIAKLQGTSPKIYIYTSIASFGTLVNAIEVSDGVVLTPHSEKEVEHFIRVNNYLLQYPPENCSLRLNLLSDIKSMLPKDIDLSLWKVKDMEWVKDCPVPEGEDFRRIANLL